MPVDQMELFQILIIYIKHSDKISRCIGSGIYQNQVLISPPKNMHGKILFRKRQTTCVQI